MVHKSFRIIWFVDNILSITYTFQDPSKKRPFWVASRRRRPARCRTVPGMTSMRHGAPSSFCLGDQPEESGIFGNLWTWTMGFESCWCLGRHQGVNIGVDHQGRCETIRLNALLTVSLSLLGKMLEPALAHWKLLGWGLVACSIFVRQTPSFPTRWRQRHWGPAPEPLEATAVGSGSIVSMESEGQRGKTKAPLVNRAEGRCSKLWSCYQCLRKWDDPCESRNRELLIFFVVKLPSTVDCVDDQMPQVVQFLKPIAKLLSNYQTLASQKKENATSRRWVGQKKTHKNTTSSSLFLKLNFETWNLFWDKTWNLNFTLTFKTHHFETHVGSFSAYFRQQSKTTSRCPLIPVACCVLWQKILELSTCALPKQLDKRDNNWSQKMVLTNGTVHLWLSTIGRTSFRHGMGFWWSITAWDDSYIIWHEFF